MIDDELALAAEEIGKREVLSLRSVEPVILVDPEPRHRPALGGELVAQPREVLLFRQQASARGEPLVFAHDGMIGHLSLLMRRNAPHRGAASAGAARSPKASR